MTIHSSVIGAANNVINRRIDENNGLGEDWAFTTASVSGTELACTSRTHLVDTSSAAVTVTTITGGVKGQELIMQASSASNALTITHNAAPTTDEIIILDGSSFVSNDVYDFVRLVFNGTYWFGTKHNI